MDENKPILIMIDVASIQEAGVDVVGLIDATINRKLDEDSHDACHLALIVTERAKMITFSQTMVEALTAGLMDIHIHYVRDKVKSSPATVIASRMVYTAAKNNNRDEPISYTVVTRSKSVWDTTIATAYTLHDMYGRKLTNISGFGLLMVAPVFVPQDDGSLKLDLKHYYVIQSGEELTTDTLPSEDDLNAIFSEP